MQFTSPIYIAILIIITFFGKINAQNDTTLILKDLDSAFVLERSNADLSMQYAKKALVASKKINYWKGVSNSLRQIGLVYYDKAEYEKALNEFLEAMTIADKYNIVSEKIRCNLHIGLVYYDIGEHTKAMIYYRAGLNMCEKINLKAGLPHFYNNIGILHEMKGLTDSAIYYFSKTNIIYEQMGNDLGRVFVNNNIGNIYKKQKDYSTARNYYKKSLALSKKLNDFSLSTNYTNMAEVEMNLNNKGSSMAYIDSALEVAKSVNMAKKIKDVYEKKQKIYEYFGDYKNSNECYKYVLAYRDTILNSEVNNSIVEMQTKYESEKKEQENKLLQKENKIKELSIKDAERQKWYLYIGLAALVIILVLIVLVLRTRIKTNKLLAQTNEQINKQNDTLKLLNKQLIESEDSLQKANTAKEKLISIISHDLANPINALSVYSSAISGKLESLSREELNSNFKNMLGTINSVNDLLGNLLNWSYLQRDNINIHIKEIEISDLADKCIKLYEGAAQNKNIVLMNTIPVNMTVKADNNLMQVVIRNLLNNAIKFSNVNSKVSVKFENNTLSVEDEGAGISSDAIKQILNGKFNSDNGSEGAGTGLGLNLVYSCIKAQNLNWDIYCEQGAGTIVKIFFN